MGASSNLLQFPTFVHPQFIRAVAMSKGRRFLGPSRRPGMAVCLWLLLCSLNNGDMPLTPMTATLWAQKGCDETLNTKCSKRQRQETRSFGNYLIYPGTFLLCSGFPSNQVEQNCLSYVLGRVRPQGQALTSKVRKNILDTWGSK